MKALKFAVLLSLALAGVLGGAEIAREWYVFGPYGSLMHRLPDPLVNNIPAKLRIGSVSRQAVKVAPVDGKVDIQALFKRKLPRRGAYVCIPITSAGGESFNIGVGADWWFDLYLNGKPVGDTLAQGNGVWPPSGSDHVYTLKLRKGKNFLVAGFIGGQGTQQLCIKGNAVAKQGGNSPYAAVRLGTEKLPPVSKAGTLWKNGSGKYAFKKNEYTVGSEGYLKLSPKGTGAVRRFVTKLHLEPGKQYCLNWSAWTTRGQLPRLIIREKESGGVVYYAKELVNGRNKTGYFYAENPEPVAILEFQSGSLNELTSLSLRRRIDRSAAFQDWRLQRFPVPRELESLSRAVKTPHFDWAPKVPGGVLKLFSIGAYWAQRDLVELEQRFQFRFDGLFTGGHAIAPLRYWARDEKGEVILRDQAAKISKIRQAECIYIDNCGASALTPVMVKKIIDRVKDGAGLVICAFDQPYYPYKDGRKEKAAEKMFKTFGALFAQGESADTAFVRTAASAPCKVRFGKYGRGRAVMLFTAGNVKGTHRMNFEVRSSIVGKALLWAAKRLPGNRLTAEVKEGKLFLSSSLDAEVEVLVADNKCNVLEKKVLSLKKGKSVSLDLPGGFGTFPVVITSKVKGVSGDWEMLLVEKRSRNILKNISFKSHSPLLRGSVELSRKPLKGEKIQYRLEDEKGALWHTVQSSAKSRNSFSIPSGGIPYAGGILKVRLLENSGKVLDEKSVQVFLAQKEDPSNLNFNLGVWSAPLNHYSSYLFYKIMAEKYKLQYMLTGNQSRQALSAHELGIMSAPMGAAGQIYFGTDNRIKGSKDAPERVLCLSSPALKKRLEGVCKLIHNPLKGMRVKFLFSDHETNLLGYINKAKGGSDYCFSPSCLASFRELVKKDYGTLDKLNASWGTTFASWNDVTPIVLKNALKTGNAPRWVDHRRNMDKVWTDLAAFRIAELRKIFPDAVGYVQNIHSSYTSNDSFSGVDYESLLGLQMGAGAVPETYMNAFVRRENRFATAQGGSLWPPSGGTVDDRELAALRASRVVWQSVLMGQSSCLYYLHNWNSHGILLFNDIFMAYPDLTLSREGKALSEALHRLKQGSDRLILSADYDDSGIAMLYSRSSEHACTFWQGVNKSNPEALRLNPRYQQFEFFAPAIDEAQRGYSSTGVTLIRKGALKKCRLLILPFAQSISPEDAALIREFVRQGGLLMADFRPAVADGHGKLGKKGSLDDVFGIRQNTAWNFQVRKSALKVGKRTFKEALVGDRITLAGAKPRAMAGKSPVFLEHSFGKGKAVLLNFSTSDPEFRKLFAEFLDENGIEKLFSCRLLSRSWQTASGVVTDKEIRADKESDTAIDRGDTEDAGERETLVYENTSRPRLHRYVSGDAEVIGYYACRRGFAAGKGTMRLEFKIRRPGHVYDLVKGKYLGRKSSWIYEMPLEGAAVFGTIPFKAQAPQLSGAAVKKVPGGAFKLTCNIALPKAAAKITYPVHLTLSAPDGSDVRHFARTVSVKNSSGKAEILLPANAPGGKWLLTASEVFGGEKQSIAFQL